MNIKMTGLIFLASFLAACGEEESYYVDDAIPELISFNMVDSYRTNSDIEPDVELRVSPYIDDGEFELFWEVNPDIRYRAELFINDRPNLANAISLTTSWCGPGRDCRNFSYQYCEYQSDLRLQCAAPEQNSPVRDVDISPLFDDIPEALYMMLEVCDRDIFYCEYQSLPVVFE